MVNRVIRPVAVPHLLLVFGFSAAGIGIAASLVSHYGDNFRGSLGSWTLALLVMFCLAFAASMLELLGLLFASAFIGSVLFNLVAWGVIWILSLVLSSALVVALSANGCSRWLCWGIFGANCVASRCGLFRWEEAMGWIICWLAFFLALNAVVSHFMDRDEQETEWVVPPPYVGGPAPTYPPPTTPTERAAAASPPPQMAQTGV